METETALLWGLVVLILLVLLTIFGLLLHSGILVPVNVRTCRPDIGEIKVAYKFAKGPYKESGALYTQVHTLLPQYRCVGVYYDDPKTKQPSKLRYIVGVIVSENGTPTNPEHMHLLEEHGYHLATFPAIDHAVQTTFPFNSTISIIVAVMKVYPAISEYIERRSLCARPFLEIYNSEKAEILFVGPLARQDDFYVPEVLQEEEEDHQDEDEFEDDHTENSSRSWDESASIIRGGELNDSECSESVADDSSSSVFPPPMPPPPPPPPSAVGNPEAPQHQQPSSTPIHSDGGERVGVAAAATGSSSPSGVSSSATFLLPGSIAEGAAPVPGFSSSAVSGSVEEEPLVTPAAADDYSPGIADPLNSGSLGGDESDANTASSFEEIDEKEASSASIAFANGSSAEGHEATSLKRDDDEGER